MLRKMLKKDLFRNKSITIVLFIFMSLSALLVASGSNMITELANSINHLFTKSSAPHFVQMHAGEIDEAEVANWAAHNEHVKNSQTAEMLIIDGSNIQMGNSLETEMNSV